MTLNEMLQRMLEMKGSDLFIAANFPAAVKQDGNMTPIGETPLKPEETAAMAAAIMSPAQAAQFEEANECNFAIHPDGIGRFRVNVFRAQGHVGMVLRVITTTIPDFDGLKLPPVLKDVIMAKRGLVLVVGGTGSGKSTSMAAMIGLRNQQTRGHILTVEDPVEFLHVSAGCLITQREVGPDTKSWANALKSALRQAPDVILIGEIRDRETMEYALNFAETGHLCMATLHANNANQALDRVINMFGADKREQLLMDLSLNLRAIISQRLIPRKSGGRAAAVEVMLNSPLVADLIFKGEVHAIREVMTRSAEIGMQTFDQALYDLHVADEITYEDALRFADAVNDLRLRFKLDGREPGDKRDAAATSKLSII